MRYEQPKLRLLWALCRELQRAAGEEPFFLSCRIAGQLVDVDHKTAWRWLWLLEQERVLKLKIKGSLAAKKATEFYFIE